MTKPKAKISAEGAAGAAGKISWSGATGDRIQIDGPAGRAVRSINQEEGTIIHVFPYAGEYVVTLLPGEEGGKGAKTKLVIE